MIRILIADDHSIVREGLKQVLKSEPEFDVAGEAENGQQAINMIQNEAWDLVLLDIAMPDKDGLEVLKQVRKTKPKLPILIFTMHDEDLLAMRFLKAGASGFLTKDCPPEELLTAIRKIAGGKKHLEPEMVERLLLQWDDDHDTPPHQRLSDREFTVLRLIASGKTVGEIAELLNLSSRTVSTYRSRMLTKMKMKNNAELTHYALKNDLVY